MTPKATDLIFKDLKFSIATRLASTQSVLDSLDTSDWSSCDVAALHSLVAEKRQLEKDHHKTALYDTTRPGQRTMSFADLDASMDWRYDTEYATYKFRGQEICAMDVLGSQPCHHNLCQYAKTDGISYLEYDTIMHYAQRIANAKTDRMKDALRKQRDGQLLKDIHTNEEWKERAIKKFKSFGREAADAVLAIASKFEPNCSSPPAPEKPDSVIEQVGRELSLLRMSLLYREERNFCRTVEECLNEDKSYHWRNPVRYLEHFKRVELSHLSAAIMNVRDVLELNGVVSYEVDYRLRAFWYQFRAVLQKTSRSTRNKSGFTVSEALSSVKRAIEVDKAQSMISPDTEDITEQQLAAAINGCLVVEANAREKMRSLCIALPEDAEKQLVAIRQQALDRSPVPDISTNAIDFDLRQGRFHCLVQRFMMKLRIPLTSKSRCKLVKGLAHQLQNIAREDYGGFDAFFLELMNVVDQYCSEPGEIVQKGIAHQVFKESRKLVDSQIHEHRELDHESDLQIQNSIESILTALPLFLIQSFPGKPISDNIQVLSEYVRAFLQGGYRNWTTIIPKYIWRGAMEPFVAYLAIEARTNPNLKDKAISDNDFTILTSDIELYARNFTREDYRLEDYLSDWRARGWCLPISLVRLAILLSYISFLNPCKAKDVLRQFSLHVRAEISPIHPDQHNAFVAGGIAMLHAYGYFILEATHCFGRCDVEHFVLTSLSILCFSSFIASSAEEAVQKFENAFNFVLTVFRIDRTMPKPWITKIRALVLSAIEQFGTYCSTPSECANVINNPEDEGVPGLSCRENESNRSQEEHGQCNDSVMIPSECTPTTSVHPIRLKVTKKIASSSTLYDTANTLLSTVNSPHFDSLAGARLLKYIAIILRTGPSKLGFASRFGIDVLWSIFLKAETQVVRASHIAVGMQTLDEEQFEPTSLNIGMHNHCNIWELSSSDDKRDGFFLGYELGFRGTRDLDTLLASCTVHAIQHGGTDRLEVKLKRLCNCSNFPESLRSTFDKTLNLLRVEVSAKKLGTQIAVNRLDFLHHILFEDLDRPNKRLMNELSGYPRTAADYFSCLELVLHKLGDDVEGMKIATSAIYNDVGKGAENQRVDESLAFLSKIAESAWSRTTHIDIIYSDDESDSDNELPNSKPEKRKLSSISEVLNSLPYSQKSPNSTSSASIGESQARTSKQQSKATELQSQAVSHEIKIPTIDPSVSQLSGTDSGLTTEGAEIPAYLCLEQKLARVLSQIQESSDFSHIAETHSAGRRKTITIQAPTSSPRGRPPISQPTDSSFRVRSPTPYPKSEYQPLHVIGREIFSQGGIFNRNVNAYPVECILPPDSQVPERIEALRRSFLGWLPLLQKDACPRALMPQDEGGKGFMHTMRTEVHLSRLQLTDMLLSLGVEPDWSDDSDDDEWSDDSSRSSSGVESDSNDASFGGEGRIRLEDENGDGSSTDGDNIGDRSDGSLD